MGLKFVFEKEQSSIFGMIHRPMAKVLFWSKKKSNWVSVRMVIDTGADYSLLPKFIADQLGINLTKDCKTFYTSGVGGSEKVYFLSKTKIKLGEWERTVPIGFLNKDNIPPLLGRQGFLETFEVLFSSNHTVSFSIK